MSSFDDDMNEDNLDPQDLDSTRRVVERELQAAESGNIGALLDTGVIAALARLSSHPEIFEPLRECFCRVFCGQQFFNRDASLVINRLTVENELLSERVADQEARIAELEGLR